MEPRIVLIAQYPNVGHEPTFRAHNQIFRLLQDIGVWVLRHDEDAVWQVREQLLVAHAALIVIQSQLPSDNYPHVHEAFGRKVNEVLQSHKENPRLQVMTIVEKGVEPPPELTTFPGLAFDRELRPPDMRQIVEFVFNAARPAIDTTTLSGDLDLLIAKGNLEQKRLKLIAEEPGISSQWVYLTVPVTLAGLALSIPGVLSRFAFSDYWLFVGPVIFIVGALTTIYIVRRLKRRGRQRKVAALLNDELTEVLSQLQKLHPQPD